MQFGIEIPVFRQILTDPDVRLPELRTFRAAIEFLDFVEWRELKLDLLELTLRRDRSVVSRSLTALVDMGFLYCTRQTGDVSLYRVPLSRRRPDHIAEVHPEPTIEGPAPESPVSRRRGTRTLSRGVF